MAFDSDSIFLLLLVIAPTGLCLLAALMIPEGTKVTKSRPGAFPYMMGAMALFMGGLFIILGITGQAEGGQSLFLYSNVGFFFAIGATLIGANMSYGKELRSGPSARSGKEVGAIDVADDEGRVNRLDVPDEDIMNIRCPECGLVFDHPSAKKTITCPGCGVEGEL